MNGNMWPYGRVKIEREYEWHQLQNDLTVLVDFALTLDPKFVPGRVLEVAEKYRELTSRKPLQSGDDIPF